MISIVSHSTLQFSMLFLLILPLLRKLTPIPRLQPHCHFSVLSPCQVAREPWYEHCSQHWPSDILIFIYVNLSLMKLPLHPPSATYPQAVTSGEQGFSFCCIPSPVSIVLGTLGYPGNECWMNESLGCHIMNHLLSWLSASLVVLAVDSLKVACA